MALKISILLHTMHHDTMHYDTIHMHTIPCTFAPGKLNVCYNALDRHVDNGLGDETAVIYDSPVTDTITSITYSDLLREVCRH